VSRPTYSLSLSIITVASSPLHTPSTILCSKWLDREMGEKRRKREKRLEYLMTYRIAPNVCGKIFSWISWLPSHSQIFISNENLIFGGMVFSRAECVVNWTLNQVLIKIWLCWLQEIQPFKGSATWSYWAFFIANAILLYRAREVANKCVAEELERTSGSTSESATKSTKRGTHEKYTPKEKAETSCYAWYHSHNKASPCLAKLSSNHEIFITKLIISQI